MAGQSTSPQGLQLGTEETEEFTSFLPKTQVRRERGERDRHTDTETHIEVGTERHRQKQTREENKQSLLGKLRPLTLETGPF